MKIKKKILTNMHKL